MQKITHIRMVNPEVHKSTAQPLGGLRNIFSVFSFQFLIFALLLCASCKKEDQVSRDDAEKAIPKLSDTTMIIRKTPQSGLFAYSEVVLHMDVQWSSGNYRNDIYTYFRCDSVSAAVEGRWVKVSYTFDEKKITVTPDPYYSKAGTLTLTVHGHWMYSPFLERRPDDDNWRELRHAECSVKYELRNTLLPQNAIKTASKEFTAPVTYVPGIVLSYPLGQSIQGVFKYELEYSLKEGGRIIALLSEVVADTAVYFHFDNLLEAQKKYTFTTTAKWYRQVEGSWLRCDNFFDQTITQQINTTLTSAPAHGLTTNDVEFSYPLDRQFNFLKQEHNKGYLRLKSKELMKQYSMEPLHVTITDVQSSQSAQKSMTFNKAFFTLEYDMPHDFLQNDKVYRVTVADTKTDAKLYVYYFKTSKYNTFTEKWEVYKKAWGGPWSDWDDDFLGDGYSERQQKVNVTCKEETLDYYECNIKHDQGIMPLIQFETHVSDSWKGTAEWQIYDQPSLSLKRRNNKYKMYGFPPLRAIYYGGPSRQAVKLSDKSITGAIEFPEMPFAGIWVWEVQNVMHYDKKSATENAKKIPKESRTEWQEKAALDFADIPNLYLNFALGKDKYPLFDVLYVLPGIQITSTTIKGFALYP